MFFIKTNDAIIAYAPLIKLTFISHNTLQKPNSKEIRFLNIIYKTKML